MIIFIQSNFTRVENSFSVNNFQLMKQQEFYDKKKLIWYWKIWKKNYEVWRLSSGVSDPENE
jgi:hypothetical protein